MTDATTLIGITPKRLDKLLMLLDQASGPIERMAALEDNTDGTISLTRLYLEMKLEVKRGIK